MFGFGPKGDENLEQLLRDLRSSRISVADKAASLWQYETSLVGGLPQGFDMEKFMITMDKERGAGNTLPDFYHVDRNNPNEVLHMRTTPRALPVNGIDGCTMLNFVLEMEHERLLNLDAQSIRAELPAYTEKINRMLRRGIIDDHQRNAFMQDHAAITQSKPLQNPPHQPQPQQQNPPQRHGAWFLGWKGAVALIVITLALIGTFGKGCDKAQNKTPVSSANKTSKVMTTQGSKKSPQEKTAEQLSWEQDQLMYAKNDEAAARSLLASIKAPTPVVQAHLDSFETLRNTFDNAMFGKVDPNAVIPSREGKKLSRAELHVMEAEQGIEHFLISQNRTNFINELTHNKKLMQNDNRLKAALHTVDEPMKYAFAKDVLGNPYEASKLDADKIINHILRDTKGKAINWCFGYYYPDANGKYDTLAGHYNTINGSMPVITNKACLAETLKLKVEQLQERDAAIYGKQLNNKYDK